MTRFYHFSLVHRLNSSISLQDSIVQFEWQKEWNFSELEFDIALFSLLLNIQTLYCGIFEVAELVGGGGGGYNPKTEKHQSQIRNLL